MTEYERTEQQWRRATLARAVRLVADHWHSGQWSPGYVKSCQADRILDMLDFRESPMSDGGEHDPEVREIAAAFAFKHRHRIERAW